MTRERIEEWKTGAVAVGRGIMMIQGNTLAEILTALEEARKERDEARKEAEGWRDDWVRQFAHNESERGLITDQKDLRKQWPCSWERPNPETPRGE